jgi:hypothetical protein
MKIVTSVHTCTAVYRSMPKFDFEHMTERAQRMRNGVGSVASHPVIRQAV